MANAQIKKTDTLGGVIDEYPEVAPVLAQFGLHCIGCHVSVYESIEQGCLAHGMTKKDVDELIKNANKRISEYEALPKVSFTPKAVEELNKRLGKPKKKFVKLSQVFGGEFDFEGTDSKENDEMVIEATAKDLKVNVAASKRIERMLRGVEIDYDAKKKDFTAERVGVKVKSKASKSKK